MALEAADDDLDVEIFDELTKYSKVFEELAVDLLEYCYEADDDLSQVLLTASLENFSRQTCLKLAVISGNLKFLAHPLSQAILADLWMGGLRMRKNPFFKIALGLICPPSVIQLEFKTREELELMPQTEEELQDRDDRSSSSSSSTSSTSSRRSSINGGPNDLDSLSSLEMGAGNIGKVASRKRGCGGSQYFKTESRMVEPTNSTMVLHASGDEPLNSDPSNILAQAKNHDLTSLLNDGSKSEFDAGSTSINLYSRSDPIIKKKTRPLKWKQKFYEFYAAPITKYYGHLVSL